MSQNTIITVLTTFVISSIFGSDNSKLIYDQILL